MAETSKITESRVHTANITEMRHAMTCHTPFKEGSRKWNFECALFGGKANSLVLLRKKKIPTAFDREYLKQILTKRPKGKDQGGNTDRQVGKKTEQL